MGRLWNRLSSLLSFLVVLGGVALFFVGAYDAPKTFDPVYIPFGLGILSTIAMAGFVVYEIDKGSNEKTLDKILYHTQTPADGEVRNLDTVEAYYEYLLAKAKSCGSSWHDMGGFDPRLKDMPDFPARSRYYLERERLAKRIQEFRYVGIFRDPVHLQRIGRLLKRCKKLSIVRCMEEQTSNLGKIEVTIVDGSEAVIGYYMPHKDKQDYIVIAGKPAVALFHAYYNDLWKSAQEFSQEQADRPRTT